MSHIPNFYQTFLQEVEVRTLFGGVWLQHKHLMRRHDPGLCWDRKTVLPFRMAHVMVGGLVCDTEVVRSVPVDDSKQHQQTLTPDRS